MKWFKFSAISALMCCFGLRALACADYYTPEMCNLFSVYNHNDLYGFNYLNVGNQNNSVYVTQSNFWKSYFGKSASPKLIQSAIFEGDSKALTQLLRVLQLRNDADGQNYLRLFKQMQTVSAAYPWNYPDKKQLAANQRIWSNLLTNASTHILTSKRLGSRYWLMAIRSAYYSQKKALCQQLWNKYQARFTANDIRTLAEGYLASYWYQDGQREKAREFYAKTGDLQSLRWCFKDEIGLKGIKQLYHEAPNSVAFPYLIQDYVNSIDNDLHPVWEEQPDSIRQAIKTEMRGFRSFANQVLNEHKVESPALWKSAAAYFAYLLDDNETATKELDEAATLQGTDRMKENIRVLRFFVASKSGRYDTEFDAYALKELKWLMGKVKSEAAFIGYPNSSYYSRNHYSDALERIVYYNLKPGYLKAGRFATGAALSGMANEYVNMNFRGNKRATQYLSEWKEGYYSQDYDNKIFSLLDSADVKDVVAYKELLETPSKGNELEQYALSFCHQNMNYYNDLIGTKYLRIEDFSKASEYLSRVSLSFLSTTAISPYLHFDNVYPMWYTWKTRKQMSKFRFMETALTTNPKLAFSKRMETLQQELSTSTDNKEKARLNYEMAKRYVQASQLGYCWAYLHYSWTSDSTYRAHYYKEQYIAHAKSCLEKALQQDPSEANQVNCLFALASLADSPWRTFTYDWNKDKTFASFHPESSQALLFAQLIKLRGSQEFILQGLSRCDNLKSYIDYKTR